MTRAPESTVDAPPSRRTHHVRVSVLCGLASLVCGLLTSGCVYRTLTIKSDPPGAKVYVNDQLKGDTPVSYDFQWYGWYRLTLRKDGYERRDDRRMLRAPLYLWIPLDLVMELLPVRLHDRRTWSYTLIPSAVLPTPVPPEVTGGASTLPAPAAAANTGAAAPGVPPTIPERPAGSSETPGPTPSETVPAPQEDARHAVR